LYAKTSHLAPAMTNGSSIDCGVGKVNIEYRQIGTLNVPSGQLIACDPFLMGPSFPPFLREVAPGHYPVEVSIAHLLAGVPPEADQRIALACLRLGDEIPVRWEIALTPGQDLATSKDGEYFGYGVDAGTGCFIDALAAKVLLAKFAAEEEYYNRIIDAMQQNYVPTRAWTDLVLDQGAGLNLIAFYTGFGDGYYPSYWGIDAGGAVACLVTDFLVVDS
jgi:Protein of unknown function (DUF4241)